MTKKYRVTFASKFYFCSQVPGLFRKRLYRGIVCTVYCRQYVRHVTSSTKSASLFWVQYFVFVSNSPRTSFQIPKVIAYTSFDNTRTNSKSTPPPPPLPTQRWWWWEGTGKRKGMETLPWVFVGIRQIKIVLRVIDSPRLALQGVTRDVCDVHVMWHR